MERKHKFRRCRNCQHGNHVSNKTCAQCGKPLRKLGKAKGNRRELNSRDHMKNENYAVTKAGGSLGAFDLICVGPFDFALVQVKANRWPSPDEMNAMLVQKAPGNCRKLIHRWEDGRGGQQPVLRVREILRSGVVIEFDADGNDRQVAKLKARPVVVPVKAQGAVSQPQERRVRGDVR